MSAPKTRRWPLWLGIAVLVAMTAAVIGMQMATASVERVAREWLGDEGSAEAIDVGWHSVQLRNVAIRAPQGWPADHALRAETVTFEPRWMALLSNRVEIAEIVVHNYRLAVLRPRAGGIDVLPSLRAHARERSARSDGAKRATHIGRIIFDDGKVDFYDAQIARPAHHIPLTDLKAVIGPLDFPGMRTKTDVDISGRFDNGAAGRLTVAGSLVVGTRDADIKTTLASVPVHVLHPYLQRGSAPAFKRGTIDLSLASTVRDQQISAPGTLTLSKLELADEGLVSLPRKAAIAALEDDNGRATFRFKLTGPLNKPVFTMEEGVSARIAGGLAGALGISIEGLAHGVGSTIESVGGALSNIFGSAE